MSSSGAASSRDEQPIVIVGAGLTGSMAALLLAQRGYKLVVVESRGDPRDSAPSTTPATAGVYDKHLGLLTNSSKRSINLALSYRGQCALANVGLLEPIMAGAVSLESRAIHVPGRPVAFQPYGTKGQAINSVSRSLLNCTLLNELARVCAETGRLTILFNTKLTRISEDGEITLVPAVGSSYTLPSRLIIGCDGAFSSVRSCLMRLCRLNFSQAFIGHGYKELEIPPAEGGGFRLANHNCLHIWPCHEFMLIGLPNPDGSFTCTMFAPFELFDQLDAGGDAAVTAFFNTKFPDVVPLLPDVEGQYRRNPTGALATVRMKPWNFKDRVVLMGDAAHAMVPFLGQGMNSGFEDTLVFSEILTAHGGDLSKAVLEFARTRRQDGDAIADMSFNNYVEMRSHTASTAFQLRIKLEAVLHWLFPRHWVPLYTLVAFTRVPYAQVFEQGRRQDRFLKRAGLLLLALAAAGAVFGCRAAAVHFKLASRIGPVKIGSLSIL